MHGVIESLGLRGQQMAGCGAFLGVGRCRLRKLLHLQDGTRDLINAPRLFPAAQTDLVHQLPDLVRANGDIAGGGRHGLEARPAMVGMLNRFSNQLRRIFGCLGTSLRQVPDLIGDHGKSRAGFSARAASTAALSARIFV